jgi:hypothetical protein
MFGKALEQCQGFREMMVQVGVEKGVEAVNSVFAVCSEMLDYVWVGGW